jgi:hypothetical protein
LAAPLNARSVRPTNAQRRDNFVKMARTCFSSLLVLGIVLACARERRQTLNGVSDHEVFERRRACTQLALQRTDHDAAEYRRAGLTPRRPDYCYSVGLDSCIYETSGSSPQLETHEVIDLLTNRQLAAADIGYGDSPSFKVEKLAEFKRQRDKLFAGCSNSAAK